MRVLKQTRLQWKHHVCEASEASKWHTRLCNVLLCWTLLTKKRHIKNIHAQLTSLMGIVGHSLGLYVGPSLELYVGSLQVSRGLLYPAWGRMLATYRSYGACWTQLGAACWQPTSLMGFVGKLGAVCWQPTGLMGLVGPSLGLYVGNLQFLWGLLDPAWGCILATYMSYGACWTQLGGCMLATYMSYVACCTQLEAVCWQPTGLMGLVGA